MATSQRFDSVDAAAAVRSEFFRDVPILGPRGCVFRVNAQPG